MKVFMIGSTGLLGSEAAKILIERGHEVSSLALPPVPKGADLPKELKIEFGNYMDMSDDELKKHLAGCDAMVFAAGVDERVEGPAPIYDLYKKYNIAPLERLLKLCRQSGIKHAVVCGSYFAHFNRIWPEKQLYKHHPYIRSRVDQENMCLGLADENFDVAVLELPYIFGTQRGRKPVWTILINSIKGMKNATYYPKGGTTMITVRQAGQAIAGAVEKNTGGNCYPIGYYNMTWEEMLKIVHKYMGVPQKKIVTIPDWIFRLGIKSIAKKQRKQGSESGLNMNRFHDLQCAYQFIEKAWGSDFLGVEPDDIEGAIGESIVQSLEALEGGADAMVGMKGE